MVCFYHIQIESARGHFLSLQLFSERDAPFPQQVEHFIEELFLQAMADAVFYRLPQRASTCPELRS